MSLHQRQMALKDLGPTSKGKKLVDYDFDRRLGRWPERLGGWIRLTQGRKARKVKQDPKVRQHLRASKPQREVNRLMASSHFPTSTRKCKRVAAPTVDAHGIQTMPLAHPLRRAVKQLPGPGRLLEMPTPDDSWEPVVDENEASDEKLIRDRLQLIRHSLKMIEEHWISSVERRLDVMYPKKKD
jgi:hypothetical protein